MTQVAGDFGVIEFNDAGLRCFRIDRDGGISQQSIHPGYALIEKERIVTGESARASAFLSPQATFNQYWRQLNLSPLPLKTPLARHNADLAFAQLREIDLSLNSPPAYLFAVPATLTRDQLGILLGLAKAANIEVAGMLDAGLPAAGGLSAGRYLYLDVQLHQLVATEIDAGEKLSRGRCDVFPSLGLRHIFDVLAHGIADQFIENYRFDPLHNAEGEQHLHDLLPHWLSRANADQEMPLELPSLRGDFRLNVDCRKLFASLDSRMAQLLKSLDQQSDRELVVSHRLSALPGVSAGFSAAHIEDFSDFAKGISDILPALESLFGNRGENTGLVTSIERTGNAGSRLQVENHADFWREVSAQVTHLTDDVCAWPLASCPALEMEIREGARFVRLASAFNQQAKTPLRPGDRISLGGKELTCIEVLTPATGIEESD
ncbi:MAG: hypothetical protein ACWA5K_05480 [bacterium]